jgi:hypothetical protein
MGGCVDKRLSVAHVGTGIVSMDGAFKGGLLYVKPFKTMKKVSDLVAHMAPLKEKGFVLAVDSTYQNIPLPVIKSSLTDTDPSTGKPRLLMAMDAYKHLSSNRAITFEGSRIDITETVISPVTDGNGRTTYIVDWDVFRAEHLALLLMCYHALHHQSTELNFLSQYYAHLTKLQHEQRVFRGFRR